MKKADKYFDMAYKIVDGLIDSKTCLDHGYLYFHEITKIDLIKAIANAIKTNLSYGNLGTMTLRNNKGQITAKIYFLPDGTFADDSWISNEGWGAKKPKHEDINVAPTSDREEAPATPE